MKKILLVLLSFLLLGCSYKSEELDTTMYEEYYRTIDNNIDYDDKLPFSYSFEYSQLQDGSYRYVVIIDNPEYSMYDCTLLIREDGITYDNQKKMMPSSGIFDKKYSLIPNQVDTAHGFPKGIALGGEVEEFPFTLDVMVEWFNNTQSKASRVFFKIDTSISE